LAVLLDVENSWKRASARKGLAKYSGKNENNETEEQYHRGLCNEATNKDKRKYDTYVKVV